MKETLKSVARKILKKINRVIFLRKILTNNFTSPYIALGEKRGYAVLPHNWTLIDINDADININLSLENLPFKSSSKTMIYSSHFFEHIKLEDAKRLLNECYRVLKKNGILRIEVPNFKKVLEFYKNKDYDNLDRLQFSNIKADYHEIVTGMAANYIKDGKHTPLKSDKDTFEQIIKSDDIDKIGNWCVESLTLEQKNTFGHQSFFYLEKLKDLLSNSGFLEITESSLNNSIFNKRIPFERKGREFYSIVVECKK